MIYFDAHQAEAFLAQKKDGEDSKNGSSSGGGGGNARGLAALHALGSHPLTLGLARELASDVDTGRGDEEHPRWGGRGEHRYLQSAWEVTDRPFEMGQVGSYLTIFIVLPEIAWKNVCGVYVLRGSRGKASFALLAWRFRGIVQNLLFFMWSVVRGVAIVVHKHTCRAGRDMARAFLSWDSVFGICFRFLGVCKFHAHEVMEKNAAKFVCELSACFFIKISPSRLWSFSYVRHYMQRMYRCDGFDCLLFVR